MPGGGTTVNETVALAVAPLLSVTVSPMVELAVAVAVPEIEPFAARFNPAGNVEDVLQVKGAAPPIGFKLKEYPVPSVTESDVAGILSGGATVKVICCPALRAWLASVTLAVRVETPAEVGVPLITPLGDTVNPGNAPLTVQT